MLNDLNGNLKQKIDITFNAMNNFSMLPDMFK